MREDLTGKRFGRLTVIKYNHTYNYCRFWECICDCGNITYIGTHTLKSGHTKSCGCLNHEPTTTTHGHSKKTPLYFVWKSMRERCTNTKDKKL